MTDAIDLSKEREKREVRRAFGRAIPMTVPLEEIPARGPAVAPGWTVVVRDPTGSEALSFPCETGTDEAVYALYPGPGEKLVVAAALREALDAMSENDK